MASGAEGEAFAARLKELKERSGLSYGQLAKRLHLSTSTLHRYCNGSALPAEFTPVDRLARLCGADRAELMDLHRRWLLADAARAAAKEQQEAVRGAAAPPGKAEPGPERPARAAASGQPEEPRGPEAGEEPEGPEAPERPASAAGAAGAVRPAAAPHEPRPASAPTPLPVPAPAVEQPGEAPAAAPTAAPATAPPAPRRPRRTRVVLASAAALVVLVAGGGIVVGRLAGGSGDGDGGAAADGAPKAGHAAARRTVTPSRTRETRPAPARSPSSSPTRSSPPAPSRTAAAPPSPSAPAVVTGTPVTARVDAHAWEDPCSPRYLVHADHEQMPPPPTEGDAAGWARALGAVPAGQQRIAVTLQGKSAETVVLNAMRVRTLRSGPPLAWDAYIMGVGCGGNVPAEGFTTDLDAPRPALKPFSGQRDFPYKVSASDPEVFYVTANTAAHDVTWCLEIDWSSGDRHGTLRVTDGGTPFRTAPAKDRPTWQWPPGDTRWGPEEKG
ncbi:helix-turn-helix domain-containing protein [Streptomyces sp. SPB074]|uniref:helix-turn-helix domain-containing protein n=1 Tax=Streptomyces sp. (strain SPB074) TaxID=465543 RepID=UPI0001D1DD81|nr:helix-turn-helix transcriptional regulator [Streptomyces sp. SPB074]EFG64814.1 membrane protein [Streptomyces sp. SPB074]